MSLLWEEIPTPLAAGTNLWFIKHLDSLFKPADVVLTQRDSYSGNLKWGPGIITFSKHSGEILMQILKVVKAQALRNPRGL